jgi:glutamate synthase (NADPH), homotetrameric
MELTNRNKTNEREAAERILDFGEVSQGFDEGKMLKEAARCLGCKNAPCVKGCPVGVRIPEFIAALKKNSPLEANKIIKSENSLPAVCGRVCPQEIQCEKNCVRRNSGGPVSIGALERYSADKAMEEKEDAGKKEKIDLKVAVVGSGPGALACAGELLKAGASVTIFEAFHKAGGVLVYGIPEFRLPKTIVEKEIKKIQELGGEIKLNTVIGKTFALRELLEKYDFVYIGSGAGLPMFLNVKGENLPGVYSANEYLTRVNLMKAYVEGATTPVKRAKKAAVIGAGNVTMDAARTALRMGAEKVCIVYRRGREEMPARAEEIEHAIEEGIEFKLMSAPVEILGKDKVEGLRCAPTKYTEPDKSGRRGVVQLNETFDIECDQVIVAIGTAPNPLIRNSAPDLKVSDKGGIIVDADGLTSIPRVYAGGDAVTGAATIILAMGAGKTAAKAILNQYNNKKS